MKKFVQFGTLGLVFMMMSACSEGSKVSSEVPKVSDAAKVSPEVTAVDFAKCSDRSVQMPGKKMMVYDCPTVIDLGEIKILRFSQMSESIVNVIAYAADGKNWIMSVPSKASPIISQYGTQRYTKISMLLPPEAPVEEWTKQGWDVQDKASTGVLIMYSKR
jgi:hypothetical protein